MIHTRTNTIALSDPKARPARRTTPGLRARLNEDRTILGPTRLDFMGYGTLR
jgi:hypothetical protein